MFVYVCARFIINQIITQHQNRENDFDWIIKHEIKNIKQNKNNNNNRQLSCHWALDQEKKKLQERIGHIILRTIEIFGNLIFSNQVNYQSKKI